jgi:hypothetical protein
MDVIIQYMIFKIDLIRSVLLMLGACAGVFLCAMCADIECYHKYKKAMVIFPFIACLLFAFGILLPSSDDLMVLLEMRR